MNTFTRINHFILIFFTCVLLFSCDHIDEKQLVGTWTETGTGQSTFVFTENGKYTIKYEGEEEVDKGEYHIEKDVIYIQSKSNKSQETYTIVSLNEKNLVLSQNDLFEFSFIKEK